MHVRSSSKLVLPCSFTVHDGPKFRYPLPLIAGKGAAAEVEQLVASAAANSQLNASKVPTCALHVDADDQDSLAAISDLRSWYVAKQ